MSNIERYRGGSSRAVARQHRQSLAHIRFEGEETEEIVATVNDVGREALREVAMSAMARNEAIRLDPEGAEVYFRMWMQTAQDSQQMVHKMARRLS